MTAAPAPLRIVFDQQPEAAFTDERKKALLRTLLDAGFPVSCGGDRGDLAPLDASEMLVLREAPEDGDRQAETTEGDITVSLRGVQDLGEEAVLDLVRGFRRDLPAPGTWKPWFPVIDYDRCTNCMQCLSFCLFGVYDVDAEKKIDVAQPEKCKTNCPACSRVCPEVAILFPKYKNGPINGDEVQAQDLEREKMKIDISSLLGGDIYSLLRERHQKANSRFSKERDEARALKERQRCLAKLQKAFDIPEDVLGQLPTAEQIRDNAAARMAPALDESSKDTASSSNPANVQKPQE